MKRNLFLICLALLALGAVSCGGKNTDESKWVKYEGNPVLGGDELGTIFDLSVLADEGVYKMYCSWRPKKSLALSVSNDGKVWSQPEIILAPSDNYWEEDLNRPVVVKKDGIYHMWYTGQAKSANSWIGYATSADGVHFTRMSAEPVLSFEEPWEKVALMCPHVIWDEQENLFKMWYSGGEQYEPDAIGYATSPDGLNWTKHPANPVFVANEANEWEQYKVTACQVIKRKDDYLMFYIGFRDIDFAQIGMAKSKDGISGWERYFGNPIIYPTPGEWDADACYKPYAIEEEGRWMLWYNGRVHHTERIGLVIHEGNELGF